ncbi:MAG: VPS10 domain-containing protein [Acidobacteriota bacterium]
MNKSLLFLAAVAMAVALRAQEPAPQESGERAADPFSAATFSNFRLRAVGPALMSGRISVVAVHPDDRQTWYLGVASGGVWRTSNAGITWTPVFQNEGAYSIGAVVLDAKNPSTVWVGTGEANNQRSVGYGDGIYRSDDAGRTWRNMGLKTSEQIGRIVIDPRDSKVVWVAAYGPLWSAGGERGLYKTADGGATWTKVLEISEHTGISDVAMDPFNPDVMLAVAHQRRRHTWTLIHGGPDSGLHKSTDGGATWRRVRGGLPAGDLGRIVVTFSPAQKGLVYAKVESSAQPVALYASLDGGDSWERRANVQAQPMYYKNIHADPKNPERVYVPSVQTQVSDDGGRTFRGLGERSKHVDNHYLWIDPDNTDHLLEGCDGGLYESWDRGRLWRHFTNLPVTQFYNVEVDNASPIYHIYGGTQDNATLGGPSRSRGPQGATNNDWWVVTGGDGFVARIDPTDQNIVYAESQYGGIVRLDRRTSERVSIRPVEGRGEAPLRFNWESPFVISAHNPSRLYFGANRLYRSDDRGNTWKPVSPDLTRQTNRNLLPVMGRVWSPEAVAQHQSTATWGNISAVSESRRREGLLYAGTDDGVIQFSYDGGANWRRSELPPGLPSYGSYGVYVQRLFASKIDENSVYSLFDNSKNGDFKPYVYKSTDRGATWSAIAGDLPANGPALAFAEDHVNRDLLFVGTEFGLFFTVDGGKKWIRLRSNLPTIPVRDLAIQERENDLVLATFGRGFYVLDDYAPLRQVSASVLQKDGHVFDVKPAQIELPETGKARGSQGEQLWMGENRPLGAVITYWIREAPRTLRQRRQDAARAAEQKKEAPRYPSQADLTAETDEEAPQTFLTVTDSAGKVVRRMTVPGARGIHRFVWNLRSTAATTQGGGFGGGGGGGGDPEPETQGPQGGTGGGSLVPPGTYRVALARRVGGVLSSLGDAQTVAVAGDPAVTLSPEARAAASDYQEKVAKLQRSFTAALEEANAIRTRTTGIRRALVDSPADLKLMDMATRLDQQVTGILRKLRGDETLRGLESGSPSSIQTRVNSAVAGARGLTGTPTGTQQMNYSIAADDLAPEVTRLRALEAELTKFEQQLEAAGVPHTPGRRPPG